MVHCSKLMQRRTMTYGDPLIRLSQSHPLVSDFYIQWIDPSACTLPQFAFLSRRKSTPVNVFPKTRLLCSVRWLLPSAMFKINNRYISSTYLCICFFVIDNKQGHPFRFAENPTSEDYIQQQHFKLVCTKINSR